MIMEPWELSGPVRAKPLVDRRCSTCRWVEQGTRVNHVYLPEDWIDVPYYECHGKPPDRSLFGSAVWPEVEPGSWCRLWEQRPESAMEEG